MADQPPMGQVLLIIEASPSQSDTPHLIGLLWTSDRPITETSTSKQKHSQKQISMTQAGFEPAIQRSERPQTHA